MKKALLAILVAAILLCIAPTAFAADDMYTVRMVYWPGPESDAMDVVLKYWNENKAEEAGFYVEQELFGRDNIMLKEEALMALFIFIAQKSLVKGMTAGSVKG